MTNMEVYFDVDHFFADSLSIRLYSPEYIKRDLYITISDSTSKHIFGSIHLTKIRVDGKPYMLVDTSEIDDCMQGKGYGKLLYEKAYEEALNMETFGIVSCMLGRSKKADRIWKHYPQIMVKGVWHNIMENL